MRKIYQYESDGVCPVEHFFQKANAKARDKLKFQLEYIQDERNGFFEPYVKHFSIEKYKRLYELRIKASGTMIRVIFCEQDNEIIMLHAFFKRDKKDTERALEHALKILVSVSDETGKIPEGLRKEWNG